MVGDFITTNLLVLIMNSYIFYRNNTDGYAGYNKVENIKLFTIISYFTIVFLVCQMCLYFRVYEPQF